MKKHFFYIIFFLLLISVIVLFIKFETYYTTAKGPRIEDTFINQVYLFDGKQSFSKLLLIFYVYIAIFGIFAHFLFLIYLFKSKSVKLGILIFTIICLFYIAIMFFGCVNIIFTSFIFQVYINASIWTLIMGIYLYMIIKLKKQFFLQAKE